VLQKDSITNFNPEENKKVEETILKDSTVVPKRKVLIDTINNEDGGNDSTKIIRHQEFKKPIKDTSLKKVIPENNKIDSAHSKDTSQKELKMRAMEPALRNDSLHEAIGSQPQQMDSVLFSDSTMRKHKNLKEANIDSEGIIRSPGISDSLKLNTDTANFLPKKDTVNKSDTSIRYFLAFHHVKIFNDSLQSICDSVFISSQDSAFRLYYDPVVWSGNTQISGDTIFLYTKNKQPERMYVFQQGLIVNKTKEGFFNQMSGKTINGYFVDGKIDYMRVKGTQSESIYYMQGSDSAYLGMNRATGDVIDLYFKNDELNKVIFINQVNGDMYPMTKIPEDQKRLKTFEWLDNKRPKNKAELFE
jgi:hypothetical protein